MTATVAEVFLVRRIQVEHELVGPVKRAEMAEENVQFNACLVGEVDQRGGLVADDVAHGPVLLAHLGPAHPVRKVPGDVLLHDALAGDAVWIAVHDQRPVPQIGDDRGSHLPVVLDEISLADPVIREEQLVGACHLDADVIRAVTALACHRRLLPIPCASSYRKSTIVTWLLLARRSRPGPARPGSPPSRYPASRSSGA